MKPKTTKCKCHGQWIGSKYHGVICGRCVQKLAKAMEKQFKCEQCGFNAPRHEIAEHVCDY